jgi:hypothetical protein
MEEKLSIGQPLDFSKWTTFFQEWLQLSRKQPIQREEIQTLQNTLTHDEDKERN